eukprot:scaffold35234_cov28-Tisochrysis_lutea.AAC.2
MCASHRTCSETRRSPSIPRSSTHFSPRLSPPQSMGVKLDELAIKAAALTRLGRMQEAVIFLREGKALKAEQVATP